MVTKTYLKFTYLITYQCDSSFNSDRSDSSDISNSSNSSDSSDNCEEKKE